MKQYAETGWAGPSFILGSPISVFQSSEPSLENACIHTLAEGVHLGYAIICLFCLRCGAKLVILQELIYGLHLLKTLLVDLRLILHQTLKSEPNLVGHGIVHRLCCKHWVCIGIHPIGMGGGRLCGLDKLLPHIRPCRPSLLRGPLGI